jgi:pentatricopeptide repeat protein
VYLYNTMISKLAKARKADLAMELFTKMKENGFWPSSVTYGAVIGACSRVGDVESAEALFEEMSSQPNFKPRVPPFNTMMQLYTYTKRNRQKVLHYYESMTAARVRPTAHTYKVRPAPIYLCL